MIQNAIIGLLTFIAFLLICLGIQSHENRSLKLQVKNYEQQLEIMKQESIDLQGRFQLANAEAAKQMRQVQENANTIMADKVPQDCNNAVKWAIGKSHDFI